MMKDTKGQMGGRIMAVIFGVIILVGVAIPISTALLDAQVAINATHTRNSINGTTRVIVGFIPLFLGLAGLALAAALVVL